MRNDLLKLLAGRRGHFRMESGCHSDQWFNLDRLFDDQARLQPFVDELARRLAAHRFEAVVGPMTGGAKLADLIGAKLGLTSFHTGRHETPGATGLFPVRYVVPAAQRENLRGKRVAIVDDAISAGSAVKGTHTDLLACGARPVACGALLIFGDRADAFATENNLKLEAIARMSFGMWKPGDCPLCKAGVPIEQVSDAPQVNILGASPEAFDQDSSGPAFVGATLVATVACKHAPTTRPSRSQPRGIGLTVNKPNFRSSI
ncbi:MAG: orotate phosphoribosyltransferase [Opitutae bacterium]|nr:orotate phosphoribosyltransferase [Opitutae bacterium]